jgi:hypothetical protein
MVTTCKRHHSSQGLVVLVVMNREVGTVLKRVLRLSTLFLKEAPCSFSISWRVTHSPGILSAFLFTISGASASRPPYSKIPLGKPWVWLCPIPLPSSPKMNSSLSHSKDPSKAKMPGGMPFIMPDGRPLSLALQDITRPDRAQRVGRKRRPGAIKVPKQGWRSQVRDVGPAPKPTTEADLAEAAALAKVGQRRQRRWLNDKLLRDMVPTLTAKDMVRKLAC